MWLSCDGVEGHLRRGRREVSDVTGAGDTVVATLALAMAAGATSAEAAQLANEAAGIVVGKFGPATVTPDGVARIGSADPVATGTSPSRCIRPDATESNA